MANGDGDTLWEAAQRRAAENRTKSDETATPAAAALRSSIANPAPVRTDRQRDADAAEATRIIVEANRSEAMTKMVTGGLIAGAGLVITLVTYSAAAEGGGRYVVAYGAIIAGMIRFIRGAVAYFE